MYRYNFQALFIPLIVFFYQKFYVHHFHFFFEKCQNPQRILTNQKLEQVKRNFQWKCVRRQLAFPFTNRAPGFCQNVSLIWRGECQCTDSRKECVHLTKWHQYIFSVSLKFRAYYITSQCGQFIKKCYLIVLCTFLAFFVFFHHKICVFVIFISTNQKRELVVSNCQRNCMESNSN